MSESVLPMFSSRSEVIFLKGRGKKAGKNFIRAT